MLWDFIRNHYNQYGIVPTKPTIRDAMPGVKIVTTEESFEYLLDAFCKWRRSVVFSRLMEDAADVFLEDPEAAISIVIADADTTGDCPYIRGNGVRLKGKMSFPIIEVEAGVVPGRAGFEAGISAGDEQIEVP